MNALQKPMIEELDDGVDRVLDMVAADESRFVDAMGAAIVAEVPAVRELPRELLERSLGMDFRRALAAVRAAGRGGGPQAAIPPEEAVALAHAGLPLESALEAHRLATRKAWELAVEHAARCDLDSETLLERAQALWDWSDRFMVLIAEAYREADARRAGRDRETREAFVRRLLRGTASDADLREQAAAYGLAPGAQYRALRARARRPEDLAGLRRAIEGAAVAGGRQPLLTTADGDLAGVVPCAPAISLEAVVALGHPVELRAAGSSFLLASRVLETALSLGLSGVVRIEDVSLRLAVGSEEVLGDLLVDRYIAPLRRLAGFGEVLEQSVGEYLRSGMRIELAAQVLHVHPNSLRHRLRRFEELTGADLRRLESVFEVWWALERRALTARPGAHQLSGAEPGDAQRGPETADPGGVAT